MAKLNKARKTSIAPTSVPTQRRVMPRRNGKLEKDELSDDGNHRSRQEASPLRINVPSQQTPAKRTSELGSKAHKEDIPRTPVSVSLDTNSNGPATRSSARKIAAPSIAIKHTSPTDKFLSAEVLLPSPTTEDANASDALAGLKRKRITRAQAAADDANIISDHATGGEAQKATPCDEQRQQPALSKLEYTKVATHDKIENGSGFPQPPPAKKHKPNTRGQKAPDTAARALSAIVRKQSTKDGELKDYANGIKTGLSGKPNTRSSISGVNTPPLSKPASELTAISDTHMNRTVAPMKSPTLLKIPRQKLKFRNSLHAAPPTPSLTPSASPPPTLPAKYTRTPFVPPYVFSSDDKSIQLVQYSQLAGSPAPAVEPETYSGGRTHDELRMLYNKYGPGIVNALDDGKSWIFEAWWVKKYILAPFPGGKERKVWPHWLSSDGQIFSVEKEGEWYGEKPEMEGMDEEKWKNVAEVEKDSMTEYGLDFQKDGEDENAQAGENEDGQSVSEASVL